MFKLQPLLKNISGLSKREKTILYTTCIFLSLVALDRLVVYPVYSKISALNKQIKEGQEGIIRSMRMLSQKEKIELETKKYASYLNSPESEEEVITSFLKEVESLANRSSLNIIDMKPGGVTLSKDKTKKFQLILNCEGQMEQLIEFMYNIENMNSFLNIERYQVSPKSKDTGIVQCAITISKVILL